MRIVIDHIIGDDGEKHGEMVIHTERADWNKVNNPAQSKQPVDTIDFLKWLQANPKEHAKHGWDIPSKHPKAGGRNRFEMITSEIVKQDDKDARKVLGI